MRRELLGTLCAVFATGLFALCNACRVERAANNMIAHAGQILNSSAADKYGAVFLQVVTLARNINRTLLLVGKTNSGDLTERRVRLLGRSRRYRKTNTALLRATV